MKYIKTQIELIESVKNKNGGKIIPKDLYQKLKKISNNIIDHISGAKDVDVEFGDIDELLLSYWDETIELTDDNIERVKFFIGEIDEIEPYQ